MKEHGLCSSLIQIIYFESCKLKKNSVLSILQKMNDIVYQIYLEKKITFITACARTILPVC